MTNLIDVLTPQGLRTGESLPRAEIHKVGKVHRAVRLYLFNSANQLLLQQRSATVDHFPNAFGISLVGHINAGEYSQVAVYREAEEELGLRLPPEKLEFLFSHYSEMIETNYVDRQYNDVYWTKLDITEDNLRIDSHEVCTVRFVDIRTFRQMLAESPLMYQIYGAESEMVFSYLNLSSKLAT